MSRSGINRCVHEGRRRWRPSRPRQVHHGGLARTAAPGSGGARTAEFNRWASGVMALLTGVAKGPGSRSRWGAALLCAASTAPASAADVTYGELAHGGVSYSEVRGVHAEICRDHLIDPSFAKTQVPAGYRLISAGEAAEKEPGIASLLERNTKLRSYFIGSLCFMSVDHFVVDGRRVHPPGSTPMAFWWARAEEVPGAKRDSRMLGKSNWLQLASWYAPNTDRERITVTDPMAHFVEVEMTQVQMNQWSMRLALSDEVVTAKVRGSGDRKRRNAPQPGFMTVPFTGNSAELFTVFTYFGHHHQAAEGSWQASGSGVFSRALAIPGEAQAFETIFQDGWQARAGLYRFKRPDAQLVVPADQTGSPARK